MPDDAQKLARLGELLATNEPPRENDLPIVQHIVNETNVRLASLDKEISGLKDHLRKLEKKRQTLSDYKAQHMGILSPLRRMPPEILGEIFSWPQQSTFAVFRPKENCPWILTHVCSRWRAVALSLPSLWSLITIDFSIEQRYSLELVRTQMERARALKVHFAGSEDSDSRHQIAIFTLLAEHSARWTELSIQLASCLIPDMVALRGNLPTLRKAWVGWHTVESQAAELDSLDVFQTAGSLVDIGVLSEFRFVPTLLPAFHQITRYDLDAPWESHCEILKTLPNLQEVRIVRNFDNDHGWPERGETIDLPHLRRLYVNDPICLDYLRAPILEVIALGTSTDDTVEACHSVESLLTRSSCSPRCLRIQGPLDEGCTALLLQNHASFTDIAVTDDVHDDEDTQREILSSSLSLFTTTTSLVLLPHITKIGLACQNADASVYPLLLATLTSRWNVGECALKAVELLFLDSAPDPDPESLARIEMLRQDGLQISLLSGDAASDRNDRWLFRTTWARNRWARSIQFSFPCSRAISPFVFDSDSLSF
ncbi:hypothetical protein MSAN_02022200 [Mycena sanguinolenta]|uniref:F-box domain-containing protein n=1 Tax=Mycena sanguinolenta TaxID=230812 RepID=A0A8H6XLH8_9AGAR|nr:hypothetical protein MSAN_02022200 [Mycena sanguinolenta]